MTKQNLAKAFAAICATSLFAISAYGDAVIYEPFAYTVGTAVAGQAGGTGWLGSWATQTGSGITVTAGDLTPTAPGDATLITSGATHAQNSDATVAQGL